MSADPVIPTMAATRPRAALRLQRALLLATLPVVLAACSWFTDFKEQPKIDPWESSSDTVPYRANPQYSVPVTGTAVPAYRVSYAAFPATIDSMSNLPNPVPADARSLENGRKLFNVNCAVCHGEAAKGDGPATRYGFPGINLTIPPATTRTAGYIFGMIRNGRGLMPPYNRIPELERWDVANYLFALQGRIPGVQVPLGPLGKPGETGLTVPGYSETAPTRPSPYYGSPHTNLPGSMAPSIGIPTGAGQPTSPRSGGAAAGQPAAGTADSTRADSSRADSTHTGVRQ